MATLGCGALRCGALRGCEFPLVWVCRTLFNLALNDRRHRRRSVVTAAVPQLRITAEPVPDHLGLVAALTALPRLQCEALVLHDAVGFTVAEVARAMGVPPGTVRSWLSRGRRAVADRLEEHPALPDRR